MGDAAAKLVGLKVPPDREGDTPELKRARKAFYKQLAVLAAKYERVAALDAAVAEAEANASAAAERASDAETARYEASEAAENAQLELQELRAETDVTYPELHEEQIKEAEAAHAELARKAAEAEATAEAAEKEIAKTEKLVEKAESARERGEPDSSAVEEAASNYHAIAGEIDSDALGPDEEWDGDEGPKQAEVSAEISAALEKHTIDLPDSAWQAIEEEEEMSAQHRAARLASGTAFPGDIDEHEHEVQQGPRGGRFYRSPMTGRKVYVGRNA